MNAKDYHIIKTTTGECHIQNYCQEVPQSKRLLGSATNKITSRKSQSNELLRRITDKNTDRAIAIKKTAREYHNKRNYEGVPQTKELPVSVTIKRAAIANHNENYRQT